MTQYIERYWRDATPQDAIKEPPMVARFRNHEDYPWLLDSLTGIRRNHDYPWYSTRLGSRKHCQVYDAPDPGEGWRLIDVEKESHVCEKQHWHSGQKRWIGVGVSDEFYGDLTYRRRIEPPKPKYEPFRWEDREQLRGRWIVDRTGDQEYTIDDFLNDDGVLYICGHPAEYFLNWKFMDTGEPVGKRIDQ